MDGCWGGGEEQEKKGGREVTGVADGVAEKFFFFTV